VKENLLSDQSEVNRADKTRSTLPN